LKYLLDTNICIYLINGNETLKKKVKEIGVFSISIPNATLAELYLRGFKGLRIPLPIGGG